MTIQQELTKLTKIKPQAKESRQEFLARLLLVLADPQKVTDDDFKRLTAEADEWYKTAGAAYDNQEPIPDFPDEDETAEEVQTTEDEEMPTKAAAKKAAPKRPVPKKAEKAPAPPPAARRKVAAKKNGAVERARGGSGRYLIREWLIKNPAMSTQQISEKLKNEGQKLSNVTIQAVKSEFRTLIKQLKSAGHKINIQV